MLETFKAIVGTKKKFNGRKIHFVQIDIVHNCPIVDLLFLDWIEKTEEFNNEYFCSYLNLFGYKAIYKKNFDNINNTLKPNYK